MKDQLLQYYENLKRPEWKLAREYVLERDGRECRICGSNLILQVHHRRYLRHGSPGECFAPWEYKGEDLVTVCRQCHELGHKHFRIPVEKV